MAKDCTCEVCGEKVEYIHLVDVCEDCITYGFLKKPTTQDKKLRHAWKRLSKLMDEYLEGKEDDDE